MKLLKSFPRIFARKLIAFILNDKAWSQIPKSLAFFKCQGYSRGHCINQKTKLFK